MFSTKYCQLEFLIIHGVSVHTARPRIVSGGTEYALNAFHLDWNESDAFQDTRISGRYCYWEMEADGIVQSIGGFM